MIENKPNPQMMCKQQAQIGIIHGSWGIQQYKHVDILGSPVPCDRIFSFSMKDTPKNKVYHYSLWKAKTIQKTSWGCIPCNLFHHFTTAEQSFRVKNKFGDAWSACLKQIMDQPFRCFWGCFIHWVRCHFSSSDFSWFPRRSFKTLSQLTLL